MTMGRRIHQARLDAGLSQRELGGEEITRNMLSALEHDSANPSVSTLKYLAQRLGKPVSYFLGEDLPQAPEFPALQKARQAYDAGQYRACLELLEKLSPGELLGREVSLLELLARLCLAEEAIREGWLPYARALLAQAEEGSKVCPYFTPELDRRLRILWARCPDSSSKLPDLVAEIPDDGVLLLRVQAVLADEDYPKALKLLDAIENPDSLPWQHFRAEAYFGLNQYRDAAEHYHRVEGHMDVRNRLEICYRELGDYKMAYFYAKQ